MKGVLVSLFCLFGIAFCWQFPALTIQPYRDTVEALKCMPYNLTQALDFIAPLSKYIEMNVFLDILQSPPAPYESLKVDLAGQLEKIKTKPFASEFEFHAYLTSLFASLKDPHSVYIKPSCFNHFSFNLPYGISSSYDTVGQKQVFYISNLPSEWQFVTLQHERSLATVPKVIGAKILSIDGNPDVLAYLKEWADRNVMISKNSAARLNRALLGDFFIRKVKLYEIPTADHVTVNLEGLGDVVLPWYGVSQKNMYTCEDLSNLCPADYRAVRPRPSNSEEDRVSRYVADVRPEVNVHASEETNALEGLSRKLHGNYLDLFYYMPAGQTRTAIIAIPAFMGDNFFFEELVHATEMAHADNMERLVLDLRSNGGGDVCLGFKTIQYLIGNDNIFPLTGQYDTRHSQIAQELLPHFSDEEPRYLWLSRDLIQGDAWYEAKVDRQFVNVSGITYTHPYSSKYTMCKVDPRLPASPITLTPQKFMILTDGLCGSTCNCVIKRLQGQYAKVVGVGGIYASSTPAPLDSGCAAGGAVYDSDYMQALPPKLGWMLEMERVVAQRAIPRPFPRDSMLRFPFLEIYPYTVVPKPEEDKKVPMEFLSAPVDYNIPYWPAPDEVRSIEAIIPKVAPFWEACAPWEVSPDPACPAIPNGVPGRICEGGRFGQKCGLYNCAPGFYKGPSGTCETRPSPSIALVVLFVLLVIIMIIPLITAFLTVAANIILFLRTPKVPVETQA